MAEWSIAAVLKTVVPRGTGGSNPSLSAVTGVAQLVEHWSPKPGVGRSSRSSRAESYSAQSLLSGWVSFFDAVSS